MARVIVYHGSYGCDTGCCGHYVETALGLKEFSFSHPYEEAAIEFAKQLIKDTLGPEHVADLDWENCLISYD